MNCNCTAVNVILGGVIFVLALWPQLLSDVSTTLWVIVVASALIVIHSVMHHNVCPKCGVSVAAKSTRSMRAARRKRR